MLFKGPIRPGKRVIESDEESNYDDGDDFIDDDGEDMDDFIDDSETVDYRKEISQIFGYDRHKYAWFHLGSSYLIYRL